MNFFTSSDAREFSNTWNGSQMFGAGSIRPVPKVQAAASQGFEENASSWNVCRLRRVKNPQFGPFFAQFRLPG